MVLLCSTPHDCTSVVILGQQVSAGRFTLARVSGAHIGSVEKPMEMALVNELMFWAALLRSAERPY